MKIYQFTVVLLAITLTTGTAHAGKSANNKIGKAQALTLGGGQSKRVTFDGQNRGKVAIKMYIKDDSSLEEIGSVAPGKRFNQSVSKYQALVFQNTSNVRPARLYWHVSGYSSQIEAKVD